MNTKSACFLALATAAFLSGCASYVNSPAARSAVAQRREAFSHTLISKAYNAKPTMRFPATVAIAPMGSDAVMNLRALDALGKLEPLKTLPDLRNITMATSLLENKVDHKDQADVPLLRLRESAARLHADAVLLIAFDTNATDGQIFAPLTTATLGLFPNNRYEIVVTALAALVDTRTGYVYGTSEKSVGKSGIMMVAGSDEAFSRKTQQGKREAMEKLMKEFPSFWNGVVAAHRK